jgi:hypothetical protein
VRVGQGEDVVLVGVEGSPSMGVTITSSDPLRGGRPQWPDGTAEHISGEGIFVEEIRAALARRGINYPRVAGETHALASHDEATQRAAIESVLDNGQGSSDEVTGAFGPAGGPGPSGPGVSPDGAAPPRTSK